MDELVLAFDVGGTNTRARVAVVAGRGEPRLAIPDIATRVASARELGEFVAQVVGTAQSLGTVTAAVVAVAGPVLGAESRVTNWRSDSVITISDLERAGLPLGHMRLVNDAVAGAWGALARVESGGPTARTELLTSHPDGRRLEPGSLVYVAPGTGLGVAILVRHGLGSLGATVVGCESQHTQMPRFGGEIGEVVDVLGEALGHPPEWEDIVSGRGLVRTYDALGATAGSMRPVVAGDDARRAGEIAAAARAGTDAQALAAIGVFYRTLGHFAQMLALTLLPCAGVVIGGASTELNFELLRASGLAGTFTDHRRFSGLLGDIPLHAVGGEVNLEGGVWLAAQSR